jgi:hypothetical protein
MLEGHPPLLEEGNPPLALDGVAPMDCAALGDLVLTDEEAFGKSFGTVIPGGSPHANDASSQLEKDAEMMDIDDTQRAGGVEGGAGAGDTVPFRLVSEADSKHENVRQGVTAAAAENGRGGAILKGERALRCAHAHARSAYPHDAHNKRSRTPRPLCAESDACARRYRILRLGAPCAADVSLRGRVLNSTRPCSSAGRVPASEPGSEDLRARQDA